MNISAGYKEYILNFKNESRTSRGVMSQKLVYYLILEKDGIIGIGECSVIPGLSIDDRDDYVSKMEELVSFISANGNPDTFDLDDFPSIAFGLETALLDLFSGGNRILYPGSFTSGNKGIPINGLIWMGDKKFMTKQVREKIEAGFRCIKLKIGGIDFTQELDIISSLRKTFPVADMEIRVDANGAFSVPAALEKLKRLSDFDIHSIEQPIRAGQWNAMAALCEQSPIPIALDEELIDIKTISEKESLLDIIRPAYVIIKPGLLGGVGRSAVWIDIAEKHKVGWWVTSALESNIGLNAIAQWTATLQTTIPQGLGTGQLYTNNIDSPLLIEHAQLYYRPSLPWNIAKF